MKKVLALILALAMCLALAACGDDTNNSSSKAPSNENPATTDVVNPGSTPVVDTLTYALRNSSWDLSPWKHNGSSANTMWLMIYGNLFANPEFGTTLEDMQPDLAKSVTISEDNLTATIELFDYIHDSKGNEITAEDVVFSYEKAPTVGSVYAKIATVLKSISAEDKYTVKMELASYSPGNWEFLLANCPIVSKSWYESSSDEEKASNPACTGAYKIEENAVGTSVTMAAIDDFWQKDELRNIYQTVNAKKIIFVSIPEDSMRVIALENGEVDAAYLETSNYELFGDDPDYSIFWGVMSNPTVFVLNCAEGQACYDNAALRKAILHALDFEQIGIVCSGEYIFQSHDLASPQCGNYDPAWDEQPYYDYDVELAKQYMEESGYGLNSGLTLHFLCRNVGGQMSSAVVAQSNLAEIGIELIIDAYDQALFDTYSVDPTQWDIAFFTSNMTTGFVTESWDTYLGNCSEDGTLGFVQDPKLQSLLETAMEKNDSASLNAFREYAYDQAYVANVFVVKSCQFARSYITDAKYNFLGNLQMNTATLSEDFVNSK